MPYIQVKIKVLIADDHAIFREGLRAALKKFSSRRITIVGEAATGKELIDQTKILCPDVVLVDVRMPVVDGIEATEILVQNHPEIKILAVSNYHDNDTVTSMIRAGVAGYVLKNISIPELVAAIERIHLGAHYFSPEVNRQLLAWNDEKSRKKKEDIKLSEREIEVLKLICLEFPNKLIAHTLNVSTRSVETYRQRIMQKTGAQNYAGLILYAVREKIIDPG
ncbi:MAG: response regulator transcription factor [Chitinophagaceae bacterium]|nr:MAG: response regulator transcription factor [Chitinophagaceae bacterium]